MPGYVVAGFAVVFLFSLTIILVLGIYFEVLRDHGEYMRSKETRSETMRVYTNNDFRGMWDVGTAAVVVASSKEEAAELLREELKAVGLGADVTAEQFVEVDVTKPQAIVLRDGDY